MKNSMLTFFLATLAIQNGLSQSIDPQAPAPLKPGPNSSMVDTTVGTQYWYFWGGPGQVRVRARWIRGQFDVGQPSPLDVAVYDENRNYVTRRQITPQRETSETTADFKLKDRTKLLVSISAPRGSLVRMGGDYEIIVSGDVDFTAASGPRMEPIVRTYSNGDFGAVRFDANGTLETEDGRRGTWRIFDPARAIYVIAIDNRRISAKLMPGQGLVNPANPSDIMFREVH